MIKNNERMIKSKKKKLEKVVNISSKSLNLSSTRSLRDSSMKLLQKHLTPKNLNIFDRKNRSLEGRPKISIFKTEVSTMRDSRFTSRRGIGMLKMPILSPTRMGMIHSPFDTSNKIQRINVSDGRFSKTSMSYSPQRNISSTCLNTPITTFRSGVKSNNTNRETHILDTTRSNHKINIRSGR